MGADCLQFLLLILLVDVGKVYQFGSRTNYVSLRAQAVNPTGRPSIAG